MPYTIDEERFRSQHSFDVMAAPNTPTGLPLKPIPIIEFPMVVYKHPAEPFKLVEHRNTQHEVVHQEYVPTEHLTLVVASKEEYDAALKDGWVKEPYIPKAPEDPNAHIYEKKAEAVRKAGK